MHCSMRWMRRRRRRHRYAGVAFYFYSLVVTAFFHKATVAIWFFCFVLAILQWKSFGFSLLSFLNAIWMESYAFLEPFLVAIGSVVTYRRSLFVCGCCIYKILVNILLSICKFKVYKIFWIIESNTLLHSNHLF